MKIAYQLKAIAEVEPWQGADGPYLNWFALSDGLFRCTLGTRVLFEYSEEAVAALGVAVNPDYQVAAFAQEIAGTLPYALARLPRRLEQVARDWPRLQCVLESEAVIEDPRYLDAFQWVRDRSLDSSFLFGAPTICFLRVGETINICWSSDARVDGGPFLWKVRSGSWSLPVDEFNAECRSFLTGFLQEMSARLCHEACLAAGLDYAELRKQQASWEAELTTSYEAHVPDVDWERAVTACVDLLALAQ